MNSHQEKLQGVNCEMFNGLLIAIFPFTQIAVKTQQLATADMVLSKFNVCS